MGNKRQWAREIVSSGEGKEMKVHNRLTGEIELLVVFLDRLVSRRKH